MIFYSSSECNSDVECQQKKKKKKHARIVVSNQNKDPLSCHSGKEEVGGVEKQKTEKVSWLQNIFERIKNGVPWHATQIKVRENEIIIQKYKTKFLRRGQRTCGRKHRPSCN